MPKKINEVAQSIKSKLSFDDYIPSTHNTITSDCNNSIIMAKHKDIKKVKRTFYLLESVAEQLDALYAKKLIEKKKIDKSDIVTEALMKLFEDPECEVKCF